MKEVRILTIDNRGRIVIPMIVRRSLGLKDNSQLMLVADSELKEIKITPIGIEGGGSYFKYRIIMKDEFGSLAKIATTFGKYEISLVHGESVILEKGKTGIWTVIGPAPGKFSFDEFIEILKNEGNALDVKILPLD
ncbi:MAG: AbrB/MazE/SpoVT family DNA-binding domain-containing protein [Promethearchaeota archaeon]